MTDRQTDRQIDWGAQLAQQLSWHWENQLRPRLGGLTDGEYFWKPVPNAWSIHPRGEGDPNNQVGSGAYTIDFRFPPPDPAPVTTIAWRLGHLILGVFADRNARHFGGQPIDYDSYNYPGTAAAALIALDEEYVRWIDGVCSLSPEALTQACGEPGFEGNTLAGLVLHIHREVIHHGAEISLLRDLYPGLAGESDQPGISPS